MKQPGELFRAFDMFAAERKVAVNIARGDGRPVGMVYLEALDIFMGRSVVAANRRLEEMGAPANYMNHVLEEEEEVRRRWRTT